MSAPDLTERELQVLRGISYGRSNREIGEGLNLSEATVKCHVRTMFRKLDAKDRANAVRLAFEQGLLTIQTVTVTKPASEEYL